MHLGAVAPSRPPFTPREGPMGSRDAARLMDTGALVLGPEPADADAAAIFVHGRGRSPAEMRDLALAFDFPTVHFLMPAAPGATWYPESFLAPFDKNEPALSRSLAEYARAIDGLIAAGVPVGNIILCGFSQGACLTAEMLIRHPNPYGGALIFTGGLIGPPGTAWQPQPALMGVPVYLTGSDVDEWVPSARVRETERVLLDSGALVETRIFPERPHVVSDEEIAAARAILMRRVAGTEPLRRTISR
jgi:phospholipase/carboxylesterase